MVGGGGAGGTVLVGDANKGQGGGGGAGGFLTGDAKWIYTGVRRDGPVVAEGRFMMKRVAKDVVLEE